MAGGHRSAVTRRGDPRPARGRGRSDPVPAARAGRGRAAQVRAHGRLDGAHNWPTSRRIWHGDTLSLNCFPTIAGYYTALERPLFWGPPSAEHLRYWEVNTQVHRRGLSLIKPGAVCQDIARELNEIYQAEGLLPNRTFGYGHSFGVLGHYYGREAGLELREDVGTVLEPNMVVSMEPMIMIPEGQPGAGATGSMTSSSLLTMARKTSPVCPSGPSRTSSVTERGPAPAARTAWPPGRRRGGAGHVPPR